MCQNAVRQSCYLYNKKKLNKTKTSHNQLFCFYINFSKFNEACQNLTFILRFFQITRSWKYTGCVTELYDTSKKGKKKKKKKKCDQHQVESKCTNRTFVHGLTHTEHLK